MLTTLISFFGGSIFRTLWGGISSAFTAWNAAKVAAAEHGYEIERMKLQGELDAAQFARNQDAVRLQAELGAKTIQVQAEADLGRLDATAFNTAVELTGKSTGVAWVDAWNGAIRPGLASVSIALFAASEIYTAFATLGHTWALSENAWALIGSALGIYIADRTLFKRGK